MQNVLNILIICISISFALHSANAQSKGLAFRGGPLEKCKTYFICESGLLINLKNNNASSTEEYDSFDEEFLSPVDFGLMKNISRRVAVGASGHVSFDGDFTRWGMRPRIQYWLNQKFALNLAPGLYWFSHDMYKQSGTGMIIGFSVSYADIASLDLVWDSNKVRINDYEDVRQGMYLGLSGRSEAVVVFPMIGLGIATFMQGLNTD